MKTSELTGAALDWAVAKCEGVDADGRRFMEVFLHQHSRGDGYCYSTDWSWGGLIIEREKITVDYRETYGWWVAYTNGGTDSEYGCTGKTPLIAAMRCYIASKLGDDIDTPKELT